MYLNQNDRPVSADLLDLSRLEVLRYWFLLEQEPESWSNEPDPDSCSISCGGSRSSEEPNPVVNLDTIVIQSLNILIILHHMQGGIRIVNTTMARNPTLEPDLGPENSSARETYYFTSRESCLGVRGASSL